ncbi:MAG: hypothetical protein AAGK37_17280 [Pseudomonadota bacterium]
MTKTLHPIAGAIALLTILTFWLSTALSEVFGSEAVVIAVKTLVPWGLLILVPALIAVGLSGTLLGKRRRGPLIERKQKRMPFIAANGLLVLVPAAFYLSFKAQAGAFDTGFYVVQALELLAGATNITLLGLNMRDGLRMTGKLRRQPAARR